MKKFMCTLLHIVIDLRSYISEFWYLSRNETGRPLKLNLQKSLKDVNN